MRIKHLSAGIFGLVLGASIFLPRAVAAATDDLMPVLRYWKPERIPELERHEEAARIEHKEMLERMEKSGMIDRPERIERVEKIERPEKPEKIERVEKTERPEKPERIERVEKIEKPEKIEHGHGH